MFFFFFLCKLKKSSYLCTAFLAQMAESVDALVSNTSGAIRAGSTPALGTMTILKNQRMGGELSLFATHFLKEQLN